MLVPRCDEVLVAAVIILKDGEAALDCRLQPRLRGRVWLEEVAMVGGDGDGERWWRYQR